MAEVAPAAAEWQSTPSEGGNATAVLPGPAATATSEHGHRLSELAIVPGRSPVPETPRLGSPLPPPLKGTFERSLGLGLDQVQLHTGPASANAAAGLGARAVTHGTGIHFGVSQYQPDTAAGQLLLAHEVVHTAQQSGAVEQTAGWTSPHLEQEATQLAPRVAEGLPVTPSAAPARALAAETAVVTMRAVDTVTPGGATPAGPAPAPKGPADVNVGFNPMDRRNKLLRAINQSQVEFKTMKRHVNFDEVVGALSGLTTKEAQEVKRWYDQHESPRSLESDLYGLGESGFPSDLTSDQILRIAMMLGGTRAAAGASDGEQAAQRQRIADAAELHTLLHGDRDKAAVDRVMQMLRRDVKANATLGAAYEQMYKISILGDLIHLGPVGMLRAQQLYMGLTVAADRFDVGAKRSRIEEIDRQLTKLKDDEDSIWSSGMVIAAQKRTLESERRALADGIEQRTQESVAEAREQALNRGGDAKAVETAAQQRADTVMGDSKALATTLGGADAMVVKAIASGDPVAKTVAELRKAVINDKISAEQITSALRGLREQAEQKAQLENPNVPADQVKAKARGLAELYFARLKAEYTILAVSVGGMSFDALVADTGNSGDVAANNALMAGRGYLSDVDELVVALSGKRKDTATVERVLKDKPRWEINMLKVAYMAKTGGQSLDYDLFGEAPTTFGEENPEMMGMHTKYQGKASGNSRLNLEDYLQRPAEEGGLAEVNYIASRAEREYEYTIDNRGATGAWRDAWGNEERSLLDETIKVVRTGCWEYTYAIVQDPKFPQSSRATDILLDMRRARATIRGDREAYEKATAALRAMFQQIAAFALQIALSAVLGPIAAAAGRLVQGAAMAVRVAVNAAAELVVSTAAQIGANIAAYGNEYSLSMLKGDLLGSFGGAIGPAAVGRLAKPFAGKLANKLGKRVSEEIIAVGSTVAGMETGALAQGESIDFSIEEIIKAHAMGKTSEKLTAKAKDALGIPQAVDPRAQPHEGGGPTREATTAPAPTAEVPAGPAKPVAEAPVAPVAPVPATPGSGVHDAGPAPTPAPAPKLDPAKVPVVPEAPVAPKATSDGVPEHIPTGKTGPTEAPGISTGVPEPIGPGGDASVKQPKKTPTPSDGVPQHVPDGRPEPVAPAPKEGVPVPVGPEGDASVKVPGEAVPRPIETDPTVPQPAHPYEKTQPVPVEPPAPAPPGGAGKGDPAPGPAPPLRPEAGPVRSEARALVHGMDQLATQWPGMNGGERLQAMARVVDPVLEARGVPPIRIAMGEVAKGTTGHFDFTEWSIRLSPDAVGLPSLSGHPGAGHPGGVADHVPALSNLVRHETDHTAQWWEMAKLRASQGSDAATIAREMWIPHDIAVQAEAAVKSGGPLTGADAQRAQLWYDSVYGGGKPARDQTYANREHFLGRLEAIEAQIRAAGPNPDPALLQIRDAIKATADHLESQYRGLPEERGAYDTGDRLQGEAHVMQAETQADLSDSAAAHVREWVRDLERAITEPLAKGEKPDPRIVAEHSRALEQLKRLENAADVAGSHRDAMTDERAAPAPTAPDSSAPSAPKGPAIGADPGAPAKPQSSRRLPGGPVDEGPLFPPHLLSGDTVVDLSTVDVSARARRAAGGQLSANDMVQAIKPKSGSRDFIPVTDALTRGGDERQLHLGSKYGLDDYIRYHIHGPGTGTERFPIFLAPLEANQFANNHIEGFMRRQRDLGHQVEFRASYDLLGGQELRPFIEGMLTSGDPNILSRLALDGGRIEHFVKEIRYEIRVTENGQTKTYQASIAIGAPPNPTVTTSPPTESYAVAAPPR